MQTELRQGDWRDPDAANVTTVAKAYSLLRTIMGTAVEDGLIRRNPCQIKNGGTVNTPERPTATVSDVFAIADASQPRYRALVLLGAFCALRWGELVALRRRDVDVEAGMIRRRSVSELNSGKHLYKAPKSEAGKRSVAIPRSILPVVFTHMEQFAEPGADGRVFVGAKGATPRPNHFNGLWDPGGADLSAHLGEP
ncbi:tyrosine-type recombinase/integrase [Streptomyces sp. NPDC048710]|uniref:tyrosine-type recombinase/integrase n=1 Tax=Streptomyces sp. NPDC048710 TaxID=3365586 RepID=UPI003717F350